MNSEKYITSGLLELYLAGQLSAQEAAEVEAACRQFPAVQAELVAMENALLEYQEAHAIKGVPNKLGAILSKIDEIENAERIEKEEAERRKLASATVKKPSRNFSGLRMAVVLAISFLAASVFLNVYLWERLRQARYEIDSNGNSLRQRIQNMVVLKDSLNAYKQSVAFYEDPNAEAVYLNEPEGKQDARVLVLWNPKDQSVKLKAVHLPPPPAGKQYQLWALQDGKPIDAGVFDYAEAIAALEPMKSISQAQAFAISVEDVGGAAVPSMETIVVMGKVTG